MNTRPLDRMFPIGEAFARNGLEDRVGQSIHQYRFGILMAVVFTILTLIFQKESQMKNDLSAKAALVPGATNSATCDITGVDNQSVTVLSQDNTVPIVSPADIGHTTGAGGNWEERLIPIEKIKYDKGLFRTDEEIKNNAVALAPSIKANKLFELPRGYELENGQIKISCGRTRIAAQELNGVKFIQVLVKPYVDELTIMKDQFLSDLARNEVDLYGCLKGVLDYERQYKKTTGHDLTDKNLIELTGTNKKLCENRLQKLRGLANYPAILEHDLKEIGKEKPTALDELARVKDVTKHLNRLKKILLKVREGNISILDLRHEVNKMNGKGNCGEEKQVPSADGKDSPVPEKTDVVDHGEPPKPKLTSFKLSNTCSLDWDPVKSLLEIIVRNNIKKGPITYMVKGQQEWEKIKKCLSIGINICDYQIYQCKNKSGKTK